MQFRKTKLLINKLIGIHNALKTEWDIQLFFEKGYPLKADKGFIPKDLIQLPS
jgi:hypothetical protein